MTASRGMRTRQRRREELLRGELILRRVLLHLAEALALAMRLEDYRADYHAQCLAYAYVMAAWVRVARELRELEGEK